jgi:hypothetical protein
MTAPVAMSKACRLATTLLSAPSGTAASALAGYPFIYLAYEWVYHYAFDPRLRSH